MFYALWNFFRTLRNAEKFSVEGKAILPVRGRRIRTEAGGKLASNGSTRYRSTYHISPALKRRISVDTLLVQITGRRGYIATLHEATSRLRSTSPHENPRCGICCIIGPILPVKFYASRVTS